MKFSDELQISVNVAMAEAAHRGHEFAGLEHLLFALLHDAETADVIRHCGGDVEGLKKKLNLFLDEEIEKLPEHARGNPRPSLGFHRVISRAAAHVEGSGKDEVWGKNVLVALFAERDSHAVHFLDEEEITRFDVVRYISHGTSKLSPGGGLVPVESEEDEEVDEAVGSRDPLVDFTVNLNDEAREGRVDPLIGREKEIQRALHILARRRKNNPLFVGDSGVGKTALVEGLALKIVNGEVPEPLKDAVIYGLDMGALLAGTRYRGDFEARIKAVFKALAKQPHAILAIDEIHTVIGAGAASGGTLDASNLLKPALQDGTIRCIGMTTYKDFRSHFEKDRALVRRFQKIEVAEPSIEESIKILEGLKSRYEEYHDVHYTRGAVSSAVELSHRHIGDRKLPDKAIDVIDEAGAAARLKGRSGGRIGTHEVEAIVATMAQIPPKRVSRSDKDRLLNLEMELKRVVFGQDGAIEMLSSAIKMSRAGLRDPEKPIGSFLFTGPTGVGKTEVAKQLAKIMGVEFLRFDMSEYMERHTVSRLIGSPPGYVGFDQGGLLTDSVNKTPHAVLLLDEIEKAHGDVFNLLLQVMDHGTLTDNNGRKADFRHVVLLMTSNVGAREMATGTLGFGDRTNVGKDDKAFEQMFSPEFRNRLDARIPFASLSPEIMEQIVDKFVWKLEGQLADRKVSLELTDVARAHLAEKGYDPVFGARPLERVIQETIKQPLSDEILFGALQKGGRVVIGVETVETPPAEAGGEPGSEDKLAFRFEEPKKRSKPSAPPDPPPPPATPADA